jgi:glycosyltransferase involved in cell wall biosynthesis
VITTGAEWLPRFVPPARRAFFHCQFPLPDLHPTDAHRPAQLEALARCEKVIVGSHFTRQAYEQALRSCGRTAVVEVVAPPVASERLLALPRNDMPFILSIGRFAPHRRQDALIEALKATSRQFRSDWTLILCGSVPNSPIHRAYFKRLKDSVDSGIKVRFVLAPPLGVLDALRSQSSIYAHACGYGVKSPEEHFKCEHSGIGPMRSARGRRSFPASDPAAPLAASRSWLADGRKPISVVLTRRSDKGPLDFMAIACSRNGSWQSFLRADRK